MKAYRDANFWVASRAMGRCRCLHLLRVFVVGPHDVALAAIVGVVPPMEPAIELAGSTGGRHVCVGGEGSCHRRHCLVEPLNFG